MKTILFHGICKEHMNSQLEFSVVSWYQVPKIHHPFQISNYQYLLVAGTGSASSKLSNLWICLSIEMAFRDSSSTAAPKNLVEFSITLCA